MTTADAHLTAAADRRLGNDPEGQLVELLLAWIEEDRPRWLTPLVQRELWPTELRFEWLLARPDVRARVVATLTGISEGASRRLDPDAQIALVDAVVDNGDVSVASWARSFQPRELAAHAPPGAVHRHIRERFPWEATPDDDSRNFLYAWLEAVLSTGDGNGRSREPILTPLAFRAAVEPASWQGLVPLEVRASVDAARLAAEQLGKPFGAAQELALVTLQTLVEHLPHRELRPVLEAAEQVLRRESEQDFEEAMRTGDILVPTVEAASSEAEAVEEEDDGGDDEETLPAMDVTRTDHLTEETPRA